MSTAPSDPEPPNTDLDVLLIEDSPADVELTLQRLTQGGLHCRHRVVATELELRRALQERIPSLILSDFSLPGFDGMTALAIARERVPHVPFIFLSGTIGEERAIDALLCGAVDYVLKSNPKRLVPAVKRALADAEVRRASRAAREKLYFLAYFDPLTSLAKRALLCERIGRRLVPGVGRLPQLAVTVFDIDHLSVINDTFGRPVADRLLQAITDRLEAHWPDTERLAHLGGGTFATVTDLGEHPQSQLRGLHREVMRLFGAPFSFDGRDISVTVKCGIARYPDSGRDPNELVQNAEAALKEAKTSGKPYVHHRLEMNSVLAERVRMEHQLRMALQNSEFELHYQPKVRLRTGHIEGVEALLRWRDPQKGLVAPGAFLPFLESAGLMPAISAWALKQAAADGHEWRRAGLPPVRIAVNISPPELRRRGFVQDVLTAVDALDDDPRWGIDLEVTEGALLGDSSSCVEALRSLRTAGMRIALDDFGTGYSSLGRLSELPIDTLKVDRVFIGRLPGDRKTCTLVKTLIELAHAFDMTTVAEGVETTEQLEFLRQIRCDESQGYLHSRPIPKAELEPLLVRINGGTVEDESPAAVAVPLAKP